MTRFLNNSIICAINMAQERQQSVEATINSQLTAERERVYKDAENAAKRDSKPKVVRSILNGVDYWTGKNTPQKQLEWSVDVFERRASYLSKTA